MGKHPSPTTGEAAAYLTLRSGRRVPVAAGAAACSSPAPGRRHRRGSACRRCGSRSPGLRKSRLGGGRAEEDPPSSLSPASPAARAVAVDGRTDGDGSEPNTHLAAGDAVTVEQEHGSNSGVAGQPSPELEAEMEAFFAAAELAERRRFAAAYNYDVALDRPLEGRYEWAPVST